MKVNLHHGRTFDDIIKAIIERTDEKHYQVDFDGDRTALLQRWPIIEE